MGKPPRKRKESAHSLRKIAQSLGVPYKHAERPCTPELEASLRREVRQLKQRPPALRGPFKVDLI
jgi:hypothetical protein